MKILVLGGAGFQGSHLSSRLYREGHSIEILNTYSPKSERNLEILLGHKFQEHFRVFWGSITDIEIIEKTIRNTDMVILLAARINVDESIENPASHIRCNIEGTLNVLNACVKFKKNLVYASSCEVYGCKVDKIIMDENHPLNPRSPYAASKASADRLCYAYYCTYKLPVVIVRPSNIFGWGQKGGKGGAVIPRFLDKALNDEDIEVFGEGKQERDFLYIKDLIEGYVRIINNFDRLEGQVINLGASRPTRIIDVANCIIRGTRSRSKIKHLPVRPGEVIRFGLNSDKAKKYLNWKSKYTFESGLKEYIKMVIKYGI